MDNGRAETKRQQIQQADIDNKWSCADIFFLEMKRGHTPLFPEALLWHCCGNCRDKLFSPLPCNLKKRIPNRTVVGQKIRYWRDNTKRHKKKAITGVIHLFQSVHTLQLQPITSLTLLLTSH